MAPARPDAPLISKWSLKPDDHNATRVRNNQRRHRARVKSRIETLEAELLQSRQELCAARGRIQELEAAVAAQNAVPDPDERGHSEAPEDLGPNSIEGPILSEKSCCQGVSTPTAHLSAQQHHDQVSAVAPAAGAVVHHTPPVSTMFSPDQSRADSVIVSVISRYDQDCRLRPVAPGESTTLCRVAYQIIAQQNMAGLDMDDVEQWLRPGFRRAMKHGEGCRVDTKVLYALIDYMSPL